MADCPAGSGLLLKWTDDSWRCLFNGHPDPMAFLDVGHRIVYANEALGAVFDCDPEQLVGRFCYELFHDSTGPVCNCPHEKVLVDHTEHTTNVMVGKPGRMFHVSAKPVVDANDRLLGVLHVSRDISRHVGREQSLMATCENLERRVESRTRELSERLLLEKLTSDLLQKFGQSLLSTDVRALVQDSVDEIAKVLGYDRCTFWEVKDDAAKIIGCYERRPGLLTALPSPATRMHDAWLFEALAASHADGRSLFEGVNRCVAGFQAFREEESSYLLLAECQAERTYYGAAMRPGHVKLLCHLLSSMVRRMVSAAEAQKLRDALSHADRVARLGQFAAALSHELGQPLSAALCNAQAARLFLDRKTPDIAEALDALDDILSNIRHAGEVIKRTRALFKGGEQIRSRISFPALVHGVSELLSHDISAAAATVHVRLDPALPEVSGDAIQLQQVMVNLVRNALDAVRGRQERVVTISVCPVADRQRVEIRVEDTGEGVAAGQEEAIFQGCHTTKPDGMGMGLAICREIVTSHGGSIRVCHAAGGGAVFIVELPVSPSA